MAPREWVETSSSWRKIRIFMLELKWRGATAVLLSFSVVQLDFVDFTSIMITFREVQDLLAVACFEDIMDEDEFVLLWDFNTSKNLDFPYEDYGRFDLQFHRGLSFRRSLMAFHTFLRSIVLALKIQVSEALTSFATIKL